MWRLWLIILPAGHACVPFLVFDAFTNAYLVLSSVQRPALIPFHSLELRLIDGEGKWELRSIEQ